MSDGGPCLYGLLQGITSRLLAPFDGFIAPESNMLLPVVVLALGLLLAVFSIYQKQAADKEAGPTPHSWLLGNLPETLPVLQKSLDTLISYNDRFGGPNKLGTWRSRLLCGQRLWWVLDPRCVEHMTRTHFPKYPKGPQLHSKFMHIMGKGIFGVDGPAWYVQRKTSAVMFRGRNFKGPHGVLLTSMQSKAALFMTQLHAHASQPGGQWQELDLQERYFNLTLDAIGHMAFGMDLGALRGESLEFQQAFDNCQQYMNVLMLSTMKLGDWALLYLTPKGRAFRRNVAIIDKWAFRIIDKARRQGREAAEAGEEEEEEGGGEYEGSLLRVFLDPSKPDEHGQPFSLHYIKDILMSFIIAGRDTTAEAMTWATYLLATHPHALHEVRKEAAAVLKKGQGGRWELGHEELESLVYLHAAVTETLRLYPSVPKEFRTATEDDVLPDGTKVYKGDFISFLPYLMGRSEALWGEDAAVFKPERHLTVVEGEGGGKKRVFKPPNPFVFTAFQAGPRVCMGQQLAYMEMKYVLACLFHDFDVNLGPSQPLKPEPVQDSLTLPMHGGLHVCLTPRTTTAPETLPQ